MTVIVYRGGILAADSGVWQGDVRVADRKKVFRSEAGDLFACAGSVISADKFRVWVAAGRPDDQPELHNDFSAVLVRADGVVLFFASDGSSATVEDYVVTGSHTEFLLGALAAGASAETAVALAIRHCAYAGGEIQVERLQP